jgi:hypothetical protein
MEEKGGGGGDGVGKGERGKKEICRSWKRNRIWKRQEEREDENTDEKG